MNEDRRGDKHPFYGQHHSQETKKKMSESHKGKHRSLEIRKKISEGLKGNKSPNWKGGITKDKDHLHELAKRNKHKRRVLKKETSGFYTLAEWELLKKQYGHRCPICERKEPQIILTIDHIIPISKGGSSYIENIQPLCQSCNSKKHTKIFRITHKGELMLF